jgi:ribosomal-protein-alanine N-acetyltransferase
MNLELITNRLWLAPLVEADLDGSIELWSDPEVVKFICEPGTDDEIRAEMPFAIKRGGNGCIGVWCVSDKLTAEKYGEAYILPMPVDEFDIDYDLISQGQMPEGDIELGYFLKPSAWGKGYATEISKRLLDFVFQCTPLNELVASVDDGNNASKHVLEKSGFIDRGRTMSWGIDNPIYRITRDEWNEMQTST